MCVWAVKQVWPVWSDDRTAAKPFRALFTQTEILPVPTNNNNNNNNNNKRANREGECSVRSNQTLSKPVST